MTAPLRVGDPAPDFAMPSDTGATVRLSDFRGRQVMLFFQRLVVGLLLDLLALVHHHEVVAVADARTVAGEGAP